MQTHANVDVCGRIRQVRVELTGQRGRAAFAKLLGVPTSTYQNYETYRVPPADVLVRIADVAGVDLRWLLTGEAGAAAPVAPDNPVLQRAAALLRRSPDASRSLAAFLEILEAAMDFPARHPTSQQQAGAYAPAPERAAEGAPAEARESWIPVLGRTAAGVPQFWTSDDQAAGVTALGDLIDRHAQRAASAGRPTDASIQGSPEDSTAQIISLSEPDEGEVAEFVVAPGLKSRHLDAFALRIDGDSMAPEIRHGDLVILSPSRPALDGRPAVVQLARQIGVTCKLYRRHGDSVHLIPLNGNFAPQVLPASAVVWALHVLGRVRTS